MTPEAGSAARDARADSDTGDNIQSMFSVGSGATLAALDYNRTGRFSIQDVERNIKDVQLLTRMTQALSVCVVVLILGTFAAACAAVELARELNVQKGLMTDNTGQGVTSDESYPILKLDPPAEERRLQDGESYTRDVTLQFDYFQKEAKKFLQGKTESTLMIQLGENEYRTVRIDTCGNREEPFQAHGFCGGICDGHYSWEIQCPDGDDLCYGTITITPRGSSDNRRLTDRLLDRALKSIEGNSSHTMDSTMTARRLGESSASFLKGDDTLEAHQAGPGNAVSAAVRYQFQK
eukprot:CAMPEP_0170590928 /NCGR_PEP_ID=MMETSP0224-20130122/12130_1 /TAXON_ID=285029 /ORGANISM="Togula jolla, Strain CCCM 725" /LENGTH=292 /DNA_ID=CAMNT_0010914755 /DNA_START=46 /DNA_END=925 /DNA_ORIENTATION=-